MNQSDTESDGKMIVGGNALLTSFGVATKATPATPRELVLAVGADLTFVNSGVNTGNVTYGDTLSPPGFSVPPPATVTKAATPHNIRAFFDAMVIRSTSWADLDRNGTQTFRATSSI